jgi:hypothetical protein
VDGVRHEIEASAFPLVSAAGQRGAMAIFWGAEDEEEGPG